jgi:LMBR1 domain-containing protein 1
MLPLDVANSNGVSKGYDSLPMDLLWLIVFIVELATALVLCPFLMYFYESDSPKYVITGGLGVSGSPALQF